MVSAQEKRQVVSCVVEEKGYSERHACQLIGIGRSTYRDERRVAADEADLRTRLHELASEHAAYGYRLSF